MATTQSNMTADDLWRLPEDHLRHELIRGQLTTMPLNSGEHGEIAMNVGVALSQHVRSRGLGAVLAGGCGFILARNPDTVRTSDISFISKERIAAGGIGIPEGFVPYAPDIAVEIVSHDESQVEIQERIEQWLQAGAAIVWVVNPRGRTVTVHRSGRDPRILRENDVLDGEDVCPGFSVRVAEFL